MKSIEAYSISFPVFSCLNFTFGKVPALSTPLLPPPSPPLCRPLPTSPPFTSLSPRSPVPIPSPFRSQFYAITSPLSHFVPFELRSLLRLVHSSRRDLFSAGRDKVGGLVGPHPYHRSTLRPGRERGARPPALQRDLFPP